MPHLLFVKEKMGKKFCFPSTWHYFVHPFSYLQESSAEVHVGSEATQTCVCLCCLLVGFRYTEHTHICRHKYAYTIWQGTRSPNTVTQPQTSLFASSVTWTPRFLQNYSLEKLFSSFEFGILKPHLYIILVHLQVCFWIADWKYNLYTKQEYNWHEVY